MKAKFNAMRIPPGDSGAVFFDELDKLTHGAGEAEGGLALIEVARLNHVERFAEEGRKILVCIRADDPAIFAAALFPEVAALIATGDGAADFYCEREAKATQGDFAIYFWLAAFAGGGFAAGGCVRKTNQ